MGRRRKGTPPALKRHAASGRAFVRVDGSQVYLGQYGTPEATEAYRQFLRSWQEAETAARPFVPRAGCTVAELCAAHGRFVPTYYQRDGLPTSEVAQFKGSCVHLIQLFAATPVDEFRPVDLRRVREAMIATGWSRRTVNQRVGRVKRVFRWGVGEGLVQGGTVYALEQVPDLAEGRSAARDLPEVLPVSWEDVAATLPHLPGDQLRGLVLFQWWAGCRPGEACKVRPADVHRGGAVRLGKRVVRVPEGCWLYVVYAKMAHARADRYQFYLLGPQAQAVLAPWLDRPADAYCFSPREARKGKAGGTKHVGARYGVNGYWNAVVEATRRAGVPRWHPSQIRHAAEVRVEESGGHGIEGARAVLGHTSVNTTKLYGQRSVDLAGEIMRRLG